MNPCHPCHSTGLKYGGIYKLLEMLAIWFWCPKCKGTGTSDGKIAGTNLEVTNV